jgi:hypothetical protein
MGGFVMRDEKKDDKKTFPAWLNDSVSLIAALAGLFVTWQTIQINQRIDRLQENVETSKFVGELIGSLTAQDTKQDIALLALDNALASDTREDVQKRLDRNKRLVAQIADRLLNNPRKTLEPPEDVTPRSNEIDEQGKTAEEILYRLADIYSPQHKNCQEISERIKNIKPSKERTYQEVALKALDRDCKRVASQSSQNRNEATTPNVSRAINEKSQGKNDPSEPIVVTPQSDTTKTLAEKQKLLEVAISANAVSRIAEQKENLKGVVYLLYDDLAFKGDMEKFKQELKASGWFVPGEPFLVSPKSKNCATHSSIRFFNSGEDDLAKKLKEVLGSNAPQSLKKHVQNTRVINLSGWSGARLVPEKQLELWVISKGTDCKN